jgi:hypothetical protein
MHLKNTLVAFLLLTSRIFVHGTSFSTDATLSLHGTMGISLAETGALLGNSGRSRLGQP